jgi:hypothetical protein
VLDLRMSTPLAERLRRLPWEALRDTLCSRGWANLGPVLGRRECAGLVGLYGDSGRFRREIRMEAHRFGVGDYKYFARPLPELVGQLRTHAYGHLAPIANEWMEALGESDRFPETLPAFLERCAAAGQTHPTPLLLHYEEGGYNCLHQDVYGAIGFPLQVVAFLSRPGDDYAGGEFLLVEQRPRAQSVAEVIRGTQGELVVFANRERPVRGKGGFYRVRVRHGVSRVTGGRRFTLGIIFHDAL